MTLNFQMISGAYAVCRLSPSADVPLSILKSPFYCISRTADELSIVCEETLVPQIADRVQTGWRVFKLVGPFDFNLSGVLNSALNPLAKAGIGIFAFSTFDTDYVMVSTEKFDMAVQAFRQAGHHIS